MGNLANQQANTILSTQHIAVGGYSHAGNKAINQDALMAKIPEKQYDLDFKGAIACVADGVSSSEHGQQASHTATTQFILDYYSTPHSWGVKRSACKVLSALNSWLFQQSQASNLPHNGYISTLSSAIFKSNTAHLFHIGDSRIYLIRDEKIRLLTRDHSRKVMSQQQVLTRGLGMDNRLDIDYQTINLKPGDRFLFTTDGVHDVLSHERLFELASAEQPLAKVSQVLCEYAQLEGSQDNLTCLLVDILSLPNLTPLEYKTRLMSKAIPPVLSVGQSIDHYRVTHILHSGTRSHVYRVTDEHTKNEHVLKTLSPDASDDTSALTQFANEYWVGNQLSSQNVMKVIAAPKGSPFCYQLYEYLSGTTLRQWMYDHPTPSLSDTRQILEAIIKAARVFQRADMVHRDLKPENIILTNDDRVVIIDLGSASAQGLEESISQSDEDTPLGAMNYIAPEYILGESATTQSDLFSIGVIGYEMLTGHYPYSTQSGLDLTQGRKRKWLYIPVTNYRGELPLWLNMVFEKACHPNPRSRYQALGDVIADLHSPSEEWMRKTKQQPLIKRNPLKFWKSLTALLLGAALLELWVILAR